MDKYKKSKVLVIVAHPDDADLMFGGTISKYTRNGAVVEILIVTSGESWNIYGNNCSVDIKKIRKNEALKAGEILGVSMVHFMDFPDGLVRRETLIPTLIDFVRKINPTYILTHSEKEGHYDHKEVSYSVKRICNLNGEPAPIINPYFSSRFDPIPLFKGFFTSNPVNIGLDSRTVYLSISEKDVQRKMNAISCYESQFRNIEKIRDRVKLEAMFYGSMAGYKYAELLRDTTSCLNKTNFLIDNF